MFKKKIGQAVKGFLAVLIFGFACNVAHCKEDNVSDVPANLADIEARKVGRLTGLGSQDFSKNRQLDKKEQKQFARLERWFTGILKKETSLYKMCAAAFFVGLLTSLTPCIYPMIPVTAGILASGAAHGVAHQAARSLLYVLGISTVHSGLGYFAASTGVLFGQWLANPYVALLLILFFLFLALSMFGFYDINFGFGSRDAPKGGSLASTYIYGLFVGLASSPCLSPILAVLLGFVGTLASPMAGMALLFCFSMGINVILLAVGMFSGTLAALPRPGLWMVEIKKILGFFMLFAGVYFAAPFLARYQILLACSLIFFLAFLYYAYSSRNERIMHLIKSHGDGQLESGTFNAVTAKWFVKSALALVALGVSGFLGYKAYLSFRKTTTIKLFTKLLLK